MEHLTIQKGDDDCEEISTSWRDFLAYHSFLILETSNSLPIAITLTIVGIALIATSRRK